MGSEPYLLIVKESTDPPVISNDDLHLGPRRSGARYQDVPEGNWAATWQLPALRPLLKSTLQPLNKGPLLNL